METLPQVAPRTPAETCRVRHRQTGKDKKDENDKINGRRVLIMPYAFGN